MPTPPPPDAQAPTSSVPDAADGKMDDDTPDDGASRLRALIREGRLSDHEADFYHPVTD